MDVKELRVGNIVSLEGVGFDISLQELCNSDFVESLTPIHINENWLLRFGFVCCKTRWRNGAVVLSQKQDYWLFRTTSMPVKYVHQLQNLYFALTGKELEYNAT